MRAHRRSGRPHAVVVLVLGLIAAVTVGAPSPAGAAPPPGPAPADFCRHVDAPPTTFGTDELQCYSAASGYQVKTVSVPIPGGYTSRSRMQSFLADVDLDGAADFCRYVDTPPTGSNSDELHCASAASSYQSPVPGVAIPGGYSSRAHVQTSMPDVDGDGRADLCRVLDTPPTPSNTDELRCLSGASGYQAPLVAVALAGGFTDRTRVQTFLVDVDADDRADLCRLTDAPPTPSNSSELRCLSAASNYAAAVVATPIPGGFPDRFRMQTAMSDIDGDGRADLCRHVDTPPTGSNADELHCASAASNYQTPVLGVALPGGFSQRARVESGVGWNRLAALDTLPPTVTAVKTPPANAAGWHRQAVTISWQSIDPAPTSGLPSTPAPVVVSTEGRNQFFQSALSCDPARNCADGSTTVSIDLTGPAVTATVSPAANAAGWHQSASVAFACSDALSGLASCPPSAAVSEGRNRTVIGTAADVAGNLGSATVTGLNVDGTPPDAGVTTPDGSVFVTPFPGVDLRGIAPDRVLADGSPGSGTASACFEVVPTLIIFDRPSLGCFAAAAQLDTTWSARPSLGTGIYRVRLFATDAAGNTGVSVFRTVYVVGSDLGE